MEIYIDEISRSPFEEMENWFKFIEQVATGSFGTVVRAIHLESGKEVAVKILDKLVHKVDTLKIKEEINILKLLDHPNILKFIDYIETNVKLYIIMEYIKSGTLRQWIDLHQDKITEEETRIIIENLLSAIVYIHSKDICHHDIKPENIMFNDNKDLSQLKLIDFGLSSQNFIDYNEYEYCGTFIYMAPEQIEKRAYSKTIDVWSVGIILYMLLNQGKHPFYEKGDTKKNYINKIKMGNINFICKISEMARNLIKSLLQPKREMRISANKALKHPWITKRMFDPLPMNVYDDISKRNLIMEIKNTMMVMVFLNFFSRKKKNNKIFKINREYLERIEKENINKKENFKKQREKEFQVASYSEEKTEVNINNINSNNNTVNSISNIQKVVTEKPKVNMNMNIAIKGLNSKKNDNIKEKKKKVKNNYLNETEQSNQQNENMIMLKTVKPINNNRKANLQKKKFETNSPLANNNNCHVDSTIKKKADKVNNTIKKKDLIPPTQIPKQTECIIGIQTVSLPLVKNKLDTSHSSKMLNFLNSKSNNIFKYNNAPLNINKSNSTSKNNKLFHNYNQNSFANDLSLRNSQKDFLVNVQSEIADKQLLTNNFKVYPLMLPTINNVKIRKNNSQKNIIKNNNSANKMLKRLI